MNDFPKFKIILGAVAFWFFCIIGSTAFSQDRVLEYKPNAFEKKIIDAVSTAKSSAAGKLKYDDRISRAIGLAIDTLPALNDSILDLIFRPVGGFHRMIPLDSGANDDEAIMLGQVLQMLPQSGNYAVKYAIVGGQRVLILYYTDICQTLDPGGGQGGGISPFPDMPRYYYVEYSATINADSLRKVLYKGDWTISPRTDSIVKDTVIAAINNKIKLKFGFEKMKTDIMTINTYAFSHDRHCYDLVGISLPINHPVHRLKRK